MKVYVAGIIGAMAMYVCPDLESALTRVDRYTTESDEEPFTWRYGSFEGDIRLTARNPEDPKEEWYIAALDMEPSR